VIDIIEEIDKMLREYDLLFHSEAMRSVREEYPRYVALYTPVLNEPDFAIIGNNPSWFIGEEPITKDLKDKEDSRTNKLKYIHQINAYTKYPEPTYHIKINKFFDKFLEKMYGSSDEKITKAYIENNVMGWNSQFIQTGSKDSDKLKNFCKGKPQIEDIYKKAYVISKKILNLVRPKIVIHFGVHSALASGSYQNKSLKELRASNPKVTGYGGKRVVFHHPSQGYSGSDRDEDIDLLVRLLS
tara:strand:- start:57 stop:782 length:726 start_codon:yes stop_codon:yes gene_type:complete